MTRYINYSINLKSSFLLINVTGESIIVNKKIDWRLMRNAKKLK